MSKKSQDIGQNFRYDHLTMIYDIKGSNKT
jgi:hypothetical protein